MINKWVKIKGNTKDVTVYEAQLIFLGYEQHLMILHKSDGWYYKAFNPYISPSHIKMNASRFNEVQATIKLHFREYLENEVRQAQLRRDALFGVLGELQYNMD